MEKLSESDAATSRMTRPVVRSYSVCHRSTAATNKRGHRQCPRRDQDGNVKLDQEFIVAAAIAVLGLASPASAQSYNRAEGSGNSLPMYMTGAERPALRPASGLHRHRATADSDCRSSQRTEHARPASHEVEESETFLMRLRQSGCGVWRQQDSATIRHLVAGATRLPANFPRI